MRLSQLPAVRWSITNTTFWKQFKIELLQRQIRHFMEYLAVEWQNWLDMQVSEDTFLLIILFGQMGGWESGQEADRIAPLFDGGPNSHL